MGFRAVKSLGWQWQKTRSPDPARISRHWFVLSVATLLTLAYGTRVEDAYDRRLAPGSLRAPPRALAPTHRSSREKPGEAGRSREKPGEAGRSREKPGRTVQRNLLRHRMAEAIAAPGPVLEPGMVAARTLARTLA